MFFKTHNFHCLEKKYLNVILLSSTEKENYTLEMRVNHKRKILGKLTL